MNDVDGELAARIVASGLIAKEQLEASGVLSDTPEGQRRMLKQLVRKGLLTRWQAGQLKAGHAAGFFCGHYRLESPLGAGGMGQVFRAFDTRLRRYVAVKILPGRLATRQSVERFRREAQAAMQLKHENIVQTYELGQQASSYYLVMELVDGSTLKQYLAQQGKLSLRAAARIGNEVALALQHAYERGVVHRDIKPSNIMLTRQGHVKLTDLGLAKILSDDTEETDITRTGQMMGTVDYMAPEQATNAKDADTRSDIYSLGCTLYQCLTGDPPFALESAIEKLLAHRDRKPTPIQEFNREVPTLFADLVEKRMLAKRPQDRFQTPAEVAAATKPWTTGKAAESSPWAGISGLLEEVAKGDSSSVGSTDPQLALSTLPSGKFRGRRKGIDLVRGPATWAGILVFLILAAAVLWPRNRPRSLDPTSTEGQQAALPQTDSSQTGSSQIDGPKSSGTDASNTGPAPPISSGDGGAAPGPLRNTPSGSQPDKPSIQNQGSNPSDPDPFADSPAGGGTLPVNVGGPAGSDIPPRQASQSTGPSDYGPPARADLQTGWLAMFDGKTLQGFKSRSVTQRDKIENGVLTLANTRIKTVNQFGRFDFWITCKPIPGLNGKITLGRWFNVTFSDSMLSVVGQSSRTAKTHANVRLQPGVWQTIMFEGNKGGLNVRVAAPGQQPLQTSAMLPDGSRSSEVTIEIIDGELLVSDIRSRRER